MSEEKAQYQSYLLRLWPTSTAGTTVWHASLESSGTGKRISFATLEELYTFINKQTGSKPEAVIKSY